MKIVVCLLITSLLSANAWCQSSEKFGDWAVDKSIPNLQIANTTNAAGTTTGVICSTEGDSCDAYVWANITCENGQLYPMMINSGVGAYTMNTKCMHISNLQVFVLDWGIALNAYTSGGEIGFAFPMEGGAFKVFRFSTTGASAAIRGAAAPSKSKSPPKSSAAQTL